MRSKSSTLPRELAAAQRRLEQWRAGNGCRRSIPESVWVEAETLALAYGVYQVSKAMRLSYKKLSERVAIRRPKARRYGAGRSKTPRSAANAPQFVELRAPAATDGGMAVELTDGRGRRVAVRGADHGEVLSIIATFCGQASV